jgi:hypothetical protein
MGAETLGGLWAFETTIAAIASADFWNPVGWVLAIVAVVVLVVIGIVWVVNNWEDIVAYVTWAGESIKSGWNEISETATAIWEDLFPPQAIPIPRLEPITEPIAIPIPVTIPISTPIDTTKPSEGGPWNVYDIHVNVPGDYGDYLRGFPLDPTMIPMKTGDIYKYGRTRYASVLRRYEAFPWANAKEAIILKNLRERKFGAFEWYATRRSEIQSKFIETQLIIAYFGITGKYPPGNTGEY